jgi:uncharacterized protein (TIGR00299 family) protein
MKILFFDQSTGVSGDKINAALFGLHNDRDFIDSVINALGIDGLRVEIKNEPDFGIPAQCFVVKHENNDQSVRNLNSIVSLIQGTKLDSAVKDLAVSIFSILAEAEAKVHGTVVENIHLHEVGAVDAIADIVCASAQICRINPQKIFSTPFYLAQGGTANTSHGVIPVPVPAVLELVKGLPVKMKEVQEEITTPTGAAIIKTVTDIYEWPQNYTLLGTGYGLGSKRFSFPNTLRAIEAEMSSIPHMEELFIVETNIDDMNPQIIPEVIEGLFGLGILDVFVTNVLMKKSRPGLLLSVLLEQELLDKALDYIFRATSTIGIRYYPVKRVALERESKIKSTGAGEVRFKEVLLPDGSKKEFPEFSDIKDKARKLGIPVYQVYSRL